MSPSNARQDPPLANEANLETLHERQQALRLQGRLHWFHYLIVSLSFVITLLAWNASHSLAEQRRSDAFERESDRVVSMIRERLQHYEDALLSGVAAIQSESDLLSRNRWRAYARHLNLTERYPGIGGIGIIRYVRDHELEGFLTARRAEQPSFDVHPLHEFDFRLPIVYIEPEETNAAAVGLDVAFETNRRTAALRARRLGTTQISGPIVLVQDAGKTPGFLIYTPFYDRAKSARGLGKAQEAYRESTFEGMVYAPLVVKELVAGVLGRENRRVTFTIRDGDQTIYEELAEPGAEPGLMGAEREVEFYGRTWTFDIRGSAMLGSAGAVEPMVVLASGLTIDAMLLFLFLLMARSNRRVLTLAEDMTNGLAAQARTLTNANRDLESFAHVVSHDLKTPIRGIHDLTSFLEEDLADYLASNDANPDVGLSLQRLQQQATRSSSLVSGILDYSLVGAEQEEHTLVDTGTLVEEVGSSLLLRPGQLNLVGEFPQLTTSAVRLGQVFANLIGNAFKYHHDRDNAKVWVSVAPRDGFYRFSVEDNGPGIEPRFHKRIFEAFATLETQTDINSSGIGLSIVKKSVELLGGTVEVESTLGRGTAFHFLWPDSGDSRAARSA